MWNACVRYQTLRPLMLTKFDWSIFATNLIHITSCIYYFLGFILEIFTFYVLQSYKEKSKIKAIKGSFRRFFERKLQVGWISDQQNWKWRTCSFTLNFEPSISVSGWLTFCLGNLILHREKNENDKSTSFMVKSTKKNVKMMKLDENVNVVVFLFWIRPTDPWCNMLQTLKR